MNDRVYLPIIGVLSVAIPLVVALLLFLPQGTFGDLNVKFIPLMNACINSAVSILLVLGVVFIKNGKRAWHKTAMLSSVALSAIFLVSYVIYHAQVAETKFGGEGAIKYVYYFVLLTHIVLATVIVPLVLLTLYRALTNQLDKHRKFARITFPLWLYVSVTGVVVYIMIAPYYS